MSDLKHMTPDDLRREIAGLREWRDQKEAEAAHKDAYADGLEQRAKEARAEADALRQRAHNMGQREAWARIYLAQKT